jgi:serine/threonine protein phosphatase PrpC
MNMSTVRWQAIGMSIRGANHVRKGLPNQDAIYWHPQHADLGPPLVMAVSDGHGSVDSFRSDIGSKYAVKTAVNIIKRIIKVQHQPNELSTIRTHFEELLPREITQKWRTVVNRHFIMHPLENNKEVGTESKLFDNKSTIEPPLIYGATLLTVFITDTYIVYSQIGDGDILVVSDAGEVSRPIPHDKRLIANETTSLCGNKAWKDFRVSFQVLAGSPPALILVSTDGYSNSYKDDSAFRKVGVDLLNLIQPSKVKNVQKNLKKVEKNLKKWLIETSKAGSGDDISLGIIVRLDTIH